MLVTANVLGAEPAPDLPPIGRSQFDYLIGSDPVPFPFSRLVAQIEAELERGVGFLPVKTTLIPLGRSLQRSASAPDFFYFPRVVLAVDGDAKSGAVSLKDRLFIGYNEKAAVLEVISYNEQAGRFEFQVVHDYRQGARPQVAYARREICLACHQNHAPIFARPLWGETPANAAIAARLKAARRDFYGVGITGSDVAYFIDIAAARANLFPVWQDIWRRGCGSGTAGAACRRDWFGAALRYALSGALPAGASPGPAAEVLNIRWAQVWPQGMIIPNSSIPNRDPLVFVPEEAGPVKREGLAAELAHIPAQFEPLNVRPPLEVWRRPDQARLTAGLAGLIERADLRRLDAGLGLGPIAEEKISLDCEFTRKAAGARVVFRCKGPGARLAGTWHVAGATARGSVDEIVLPHAVAPAAIELEGSAAGRFALRREGLRARLADGRALQKVEFTVNRAGTGSAALTLRDDLSRVSTALAKLPAGDEAFHAREWMTRLLSALDIRPPARREASLPPPQAHTQARAADRPGILASFQRYCGQCHDTGERFPPNFLHGDAGAVSARLEHCAERIFYRLSMWNLDEPGRKKTPMPPVASLASHGFDAATWARAPELAQLRAYAERRLGAAQSPQHVLGQPFERLRACLPPGR